MRDIVPAALSLAILLTSAAIRADENPGLKKAFIDGNGPGWKELTLDDFEHVNCDPDTWSMSDGMIQCTGQPVGVIRSKKKYTNLELVVEWRHLQHAGNSGVFLWASEEALKDLPRGKLPPGGIEVQILDIGYEENWEKKNGSKSDWFTSHGDVFPVGSSKMVPFPPVAPSPKASSRSFPSQRLSRRSPEWNHYYVRAINGEVRLWVNGVEVSGGHDCVPATGYLCLESEGAPVEFRNLRIRELP